MFRKTILAGIVAGLLLCLGVFAFAKTPPPAGGDRVARLTKELNLTPDQQTKARTIFENARQQELQVLTPEQRTAMKNRQERMAEAWKSLNLTADQKAKIEAIREESRTKARAIMANTTLTKEQKRTQLNDLRKSTDAQIMQVLTPDQQAKLRAAEATPRATPLTKEQRQEMRAIRQQAMKDFRAILTPEQQQKFDQMHMNRRPAK